MPKPRWSTVAGINFALGITLWFGFLTDYSWVKTIPDILFPPFVGVVGLLSLIFVADKAGETNKIKKMFESFACFPSLFGSLLSVLTVILMLIPPFTMGFIFMMVEKEDEVLIQQTVSPNRLQTAEVYFTPVGAYGSGNGRVSVRIKPRLFPLVERDVFFLNNSYIDGNTSNYLSWVYNDTLFITEVQEEIHLGKIGLQLSPSIAFPMNVFRYYRYRRLEQQQIAPVSDVPIFPGDVRADDANYRQDLETSLRSYDIWDHTLDELVEWHQESLSEPPWSVVQINRDVIEKSTAVHTKYCIKVQYSTEGEQINYFWEIWGWDQSTRIHVLISTPKPVTDTCLRHQSQP